MHARTHARTHFPGGAMVNNLLVNAGDAKDVSSIPGLERSSGLGKGNHSSILAWKIPWTEEKVGYSHGPNPHPLYWKGGFLTPGPPGESLRNLFR